MATQLSKSHLEGKVPSNAVNVVIRFGFDSPNITKSEFLEISAIWRP